MTTFTACSTICGNASLVFTGCSSSVYRHAPADARVGGEWRTIFNGVDTARYTCQPRVAPDAPLMFLGRLDPIKGAHHAIAIARAARRRLVIAGTRVVDGPDAGYFDRSIAPHVDGDSVAMQWRYRVAIRTPRTRARDRPTRYSPRARSRRWDGRSAQAFAPARP